MEPMFEWDDGNRPEIADHNVTEAECVEALADPMRVPRHAYNVTYEGFGEEERFGIIGRTEAGRLLVVISTPRGEGFRVITAWSARGPDAQVYQEANP